MSIPELREELHKWADRASDEQIASGAQLLADGLRQTALQEAYERRDAFLAGQNELFTMEQAFQFVKDQTSGRAA